MVFVVVMIFTTSSNSVAPQSRRPNPGAGDPRVRRRVTREIDELAGIDAELKHASELAPELVALLGTLDAQRAAVERDGQIDRPSAEKLGAMQGLLVARPAERREEIPAVRDDGRCEVEDGEEWEWRRRPGSNRRMEVLQTSALPLGYVAHRRKVGECSEPPSERQYSTCCPG